MVEEVIWGIKIVKRCKAILTITSGVICCLFLIALSLSYRLTLADSDPKTGRIISHDSIAMSDHSRCGMSQGDMVFFSFEVPYTGSIMHLGVESHKVEKRWAVGNFGFVEERFFDINWKFVEKDSGAAFPGIYYRSFFWKDRELPWWTLRVSLWYPISIFAVLPMIWLIRRYQIYRKNPTDLPAVVMLKKP